MDDILRPAASDLRRMWDEQADFNRNFRTVEAMTPDQRMYEAKELVLHLFSECDELLRSMGAWKPHRVVDVRVNPRHERLEIADIFKYLMSIAQVRGLTFEDFVDGFWEKSMVVRQRYSQEFVIDHLDMSAIIVDIDNVLADYITGFMAWCVRNGFTSQETADTLMREHNFISAEMVVPSHTAPELKHLWNTSGEYATLPVMPGARTFLEQAMLAGTGVILLTARPIDRYPNIFAETLSWLNVNELPFNHVWWARDKGEAILSLKPSLYMGFAVDDDWDHIVQYERRGHRAYWLNPSTRVNGYQDSALNGNTRIKMVRSLEEIWDGEEGERQRVIGNIRREGHL